MSIDIEPVIPPAYEQMVATVVGWSFYEIVACGAAELAAATGAALHLVHVGTPDAKGESTMRPYLAGQLASLVPGCVPEWLEGDPVHPAAALDDYLQTMGHSVGAVACHGYRGIDLLLGSVTEDLLAKGRPVVVYGLAALPVKPRRVAVCLDGSSWAERVVPEGARWARALGVRLWLVQAVDPSTSAATAERAESSSLHGVAERWRSTGLDVQWEVLHAHHIGRGLASWLNAEPATLTVAATHGRSGLKRAMLGGVANQLVRHVEGPMILQLVH